MGNTQMSENIGNKKEVKWYVISFLAGAATSVAMIMLSLRFYVSMKHPYFLFFVTLLVVQALMLFMRNRGGAKASLGNLLTFFGRAAMFILGGAGAFYCLLAIYPPNMS